MRYPLLDTLADTDRHDVLARGRRRRFARNEVIFHEGDPAAAMHLLERGHVGIRMSTPLGDVATVRIVRPGDFFGELALVSPAARNATAVALDAVETITLDREQVANLRADHPKVETVMLDALATEIRRLADQLVEAMYLPTETRLWRRLLELAFAFGTHDQAARDIPVTQDLVAQLAGCTRQTANQLLRIGSEANVIRIARANIEILDLDELRRRAH